MLTHWIANQPRPSTRAGRGIAVIDPATEAALEQVPDEPAIVDEAVGAAYAAFGHWSRLEPTLRRDLLVQASDRLLQTKEVIVDLHIQETGKTREQALAEIGGAAVAVRSMADLGVYIQAGAEQSAGGELLFQYREPRGVAACIVPWNYPIVTAAENIAANLVMGNTIVLKPSEKTPMATRAMAEVAFAHLPDGVCNVVLGGGNVGARLIEDPRIELIVFVGSPGVGRTISALAAPTFKKLVLELGGKDAMIVDETVNPREAARLAAECVFVNVGQICTSTERIYVTREAYQEFVDALVDESTAYVPGDSRVESATLGPLIDHGQLERVETQVRAAVDRGARLLRGGKRLARNGFFYPPTVLTDVPPDTRLMCEETFGPVAPVAAVDSFEEAIDRANDTRYGLAAVVCTDSAERAIQAIQNLRVGMVKVNAPRGRVAQSTSEPSGISGVGHGYGIEYLCEITRQKSVHWRSRP